jgi:hypothetical protein
MRMYRNFELNGNHYQTKTYGAVPKRPGHIPSWTLTIRAIKILSKTC